MASKLCCILEGLIHRQRADVVVVLSHVSCHHGRQRLAFVVAAVVQHLASDVAVVLALREDVEQRRLACSTASEDAGDFTFLESCESNVSRCVGHPRERERVRDHDAR